GHSPVDRRWDEKLEHSLGAYSIIAAKKAMEDAGIKPDDVDGVVSAPGPLGAEWDRPFFDPPYDSEDGISLVTAEWLTKNLGLKNVKWVNSDPVMPDMAGALGVAAQALGEGLCNTCLVLYPTGNLAGRYRHEVETHAKGETVWRNPWAWSGITSSAYRFQQYCLKYNTNHDRLAPFVVNLRRNGRMFPYGYYVQHPEPPLTVEDYLASRWVCKPMCLHDADRPVNAATCYVLTRAERARDMKQKPVYILNHNNNRFKTRSTIETLEEAETNCAAMARRMYEGSGLTPREVDIFNPYDGYTLFSQHYLEAFQWHGVKKGEAHDFYAGDISVEGPHPFLS
ncbi:MAG: hypothetical protein Q8P59_08850, partial [Dehalococcoidia bacterium]|nr:hypothetical protein [Dehalococcoidia bacterium]